MIEELRNDIDAQTFRLDQKVETVNFLDDLTKNLSSDIENFNGALSTHKNTLIEEINKLNEEFQKSNDMYKQFVNQTEEKANQSLNKSQAIGISVNKMEKECENMKTNIQALQKSLKTTQHEKLDISTFDQHLEDTEQRKADVNNRFADVNNLLLMRDTFIDRIYPLRVMTMISNALHS